MRPWSIWAWASCSSALVAVAPARAEGTYPTAESVLREFFPGAGNVTYLEVAAERLPAAVRGSRQRYVLFVAKRDGDIEGYAFIDDEPGQHQPITMAVKLDRQGVVERTEVMVYREPYGEEIRQARFRAQFSGKGAADPIRIGRDIDAVSGATISSRAMASVVRRAVALVGEVRAQTGGK